MNEFDENNTDTPRISTGIQIAFMISWMLTTILAVTAYLNYKAAEELRQELQVLKARQPAQQAPAE